MTGVVVAVDTEYEDHVVGVLGRLPEVTIVARPAEITELLALLAAGRADVVVLSEYFPGMSAEAARRVLADAPAVLGLGAEGGTLHTWGVRALVDPMVGEHDWNAALQGCAAGTGEGAAETRRNGAGRSPEARGDASGPAIPGTATTEAAASPEETGTDRGTTADRGRGTDPFESAGADPEGDDGADRGTVVAVWGTGGAPGRSTVAASLAKELSRHSTVVLVDADTVFAAQASLWGLLDDDPHLVSLCRARARRPWTEGTLETHSARIGKNLRVVTGLSRAERWPEIDPVTLSEVLDDLSAAAKYVVVDLTDRIDPDDDFADPHYDRHSATRAVLERADTTLLVAAGDPVGLQRLIALLGTERGAELGGRAGLVVNKVRASAVGTRPEERIGATLRRFVDPDLAPVYLPFAPETLDPAVLAGRPPTEAAPNSAFSVAIAGLASSVSGTPMRRSRRTRGARIFARAGGGV